MASDTNKAYRGKKGKTYKKPFFLAALVSKVRFKNINASKLSVKLYDDIAAKRINTSNYIYFRKLSCTIFKLSNLVVAGYKVRAKSTSNCFFSQHVF